MKHVVVTSGVCTPYSMQRSSAQLLRRQPGAFQARQTTPVWLSGLLKARCLSAASSAASTDTAAGPVEAAAEPAPLPAAPTLAPIPEAILQRNDELVEALRGKLILAPLTRWVGSGLAGRPSLGSCPCTVQLWQSAAMTITTANRLLVPVAWPAGAATCPSAGCAPTLGQRPR